MYTIFKKIQKLKQKKDERGITLVIAITTMTLLLSISLSISNIVLRQIRITNINNASKPAFFTADSAMECAFYYDTKEILNGEGVNTNADFANTIFGGMNINDVRTAVKCGNTDLLALTKVETTGGPSGKVYVTNFDVDYGGMCAKVTVERSEVSTRIISRGYNTDATPLGCNLADISKRRLVERGLTITY